MTASGMDRQEFGRRLQLSCWLTGRFALRSGLESDGYFDKYLFESDPELLQAVAALTALLIPGDIEIVAGLELGGIPVATALSLVTGLPQVLVRKEAKSYGTAKLAEGPAVEGRKVLVVEDVITTGGQVVASTEELRSRGTLPDNPVAHWCNQVAAELLVPLSELTAAMGPDFEIYEELDALARRFKVSTVVVLRRARDAGRLHWEEYQEAFEAELAKVRQVLDERTSGGRRLLQYAASPHQPALRPRRDRQRARGADAAPGCLPDARSTKVVDLRGAGGPARSRMMVFLLDTNVFIDAKNQYYAFDFCPAFWDWIDQAHRSGSIFSIDKVAAELGAVDDHLASWADQRPGTLPGGGCPYPAKSPNHQHLGDRRRIRAGRGSNLPSGC